MLPWRKGVVSSTALISDSASSEAASQRVAVVQRPPGVGSTQPLPPPLQLAWMRVLARLDCALSGGPASSILSSPGTRLCSQCLHVRKLHLRQTIKGNCLSPAECLIEKRSLGFARKICKPVCLPKCMLDDEGAKSPES